MALSLHEAAMIFDKEKQRLAEIEKRRIAREKKEKEARMAVDPKVIRKKRITEEIKIFKETQTGDGRDHFFDIMSLLSSSGKEILIGVDEEQSDDKSIASCVLRRDGFRMKTKTKEKTKYDGFSFEDMHPSSVAKFFCENLDIPETMSFTEYIDKELSKIIAEAEAIQNKKNRRKKK